MAYRMDYVPTVLLVEDDDGERAQLRWRLQASGYRVIDADNGRDAVAGALAINPDLLLVDLNVPLPYEVTAARRIVEQARLGALPVILVASEGDLPYEQEVKVRRNEYVMRLSGYEQLEHLLGYLLPAGPTAH